MIFTMVNFLFSNQNQNNYNKLKKRNFHNPKNVSRQIKYLPNLIKNNNPNFSYNFI